MTVTHRPPLPPKDASLLEPYILDMLTAAGSDLPREDILREIEGVPEFALRPAATYAFQVVMSLYETQELRRRIDRTRSWYLALILLLVASSFNFALGPIMPGWLFDLFRILLCAGTVVGLIKFWRHW